MHALIEVFDYHGGPYWIELERKSRTWILWSDDDQDDVAMLRVRLVPVEGSDHLQWEALTWGGRKIVAPSMRSLLVKQWDDWRTEMDEEGHPSPLVGYEGIRSGAQVMA